jgi:hypothetical protein
LERKTRLLLDRGRNQSFSLPRASPDGRDLVFSQKTWENNVWLLENF